MREVVDREQRVQAPDVAQAADVVDDVRAAPAQLLREVRAQRRRDERPAVRGDGQRRQVAGLDDLAGEEAILAVLDRDAEHRARLEHRLELDEHRSAGTR